MLSCIYERCLELPFSSLSLSGFIFQNQQHISVVETVKDAQILKIERYMILATLFTENFRKEFYHILSTTLKMFWCYKKRFSQFHVRL